MRKLFCIASFLVLAILLQPGCKTPSTQSGSSAGTEATADSLRPLAKNIILLIGDGMGLPQISAGMYLNGNHTSLEEFPVTGIHKSHSADNIITDSAAGATAFACGIKTKNGAVAVDPDGNPHETILEEAIRKGKATGLIVTSTIVHATPASFAAHDPNRRNYEAIALDMAESGVDLMIGGGLKFFTRRADGRDLTAEMQRNGYIISSYFNDDLNTAVLPLKQKYLFLTADEDPLPYASGRDYLIPAVEKGLSYMKRNGRKEGFFLMIEGSQIDWGGHANNADYVIQEFLEFDKVIEMCLEFARKDGETLVIVTADHETGGLTLDPENEKNYNKLELSFSTGGHTAVMIPVFASGPGSGLFTGLYDNTAIYGKMRRAFGFGPKQGVEP